MRVAVRTEQAGADEVGARLANAGAVAVTLSPADGNAGEVLEPDPGQTPTWRTVRLDGLFAVDADLSSLAGLDVEVDFVPDRDWSETWREGFGPLRFGRLLVLPKASRLEPGCDDVVLRLDPGLAFGTGTHATTALCLERLAPMPLGGKRVLDVGSGSGILAIAAARLGAAAVAVDHDPQARRATRANGRDNGVVIVVEGDLADVDGRFDAVFANLVAATIRDLADVLLQRLAPSGELILSGILPGQVEWVMQAFAPDPGLVFEEPAFRDGWAMLRGVRCPNPTNR